MKTENGRDANCRAQKKFRQKQKFCKKQKMTVIEQSSANTEDGLGISSLATNPVLKEDTKSESSINEATNAQKSPVEDQMGHKKTKSQPMSQQSPRKPGRSTKPKAIRLCCVCGHQIFRIRSRDYYRAERRRKVGRHDDIKKTKS
jgi:hypothetical protein